MPSFVNTLRRWCSTGVQLSAVGLERASRLAQGDREPPDLGVLHGLTTAGLLRWPAQDQAGQDGLDERAAGDLAVSIVPIQQQCPQSIGMDADLVMPRPIAFARGRITHSRKRDETR